MAHIILNCKYIVSALNGSSDNTKPKTDAKHDPIEEAPNPIKIYLM